MEKLGKGFYLRPAIESSTDFLGKVLVHKTPFGRVSGVVTDVEAYPSFIDEVHHGNKKTPRTEVMWREGGYAYVYVIYGIWNQCAAVVNKLNIPDVVFIRASFSLEGREIMEQQWNKPIKDKDLACSPGKLCKSMLITKSLYGVDLTGNELFFEDWGIQIPKDLIKMTWRVGIDAKHRGFGNPWRFWVAADQIKLPKW